MSVCRGIRFGFFLRCFIRSRYLLKWSWGSIRNSFILFFGGRYWEDERSLGIFRLVI